MPSIEEGELTGGEEGRPLRLRDMGGSKGAASMARRRGEEGRGRRSAGARKKKPVPLGRKAWWAGLAAWAGRGWLGPAGRPRPGRGGREVAGWAEEACRAAGSAGPKARKGKKKKEFPN
jgi:hypothetical protein